VFGSAILCFDAFPPNFRLWFADSLYPRSDPDPDRGLGYLVLAVFPGLPGLCNFLPVFRLRSSPCGGIVADRISAPEVVDPHQSALMVPAVTLGILPTFDPTRIL
jgi:hypothetical protein